MDVVHSGFDGLRLTVQSEIPPAFREQLAAAKARAIETNAEVPLDCGGVRLSVRRTGGAAFSAHTGEYGAEWYFLDPENRSRNAPGVTVDFRAFLLATGGLDAACALLDECIAAFGIPFVEPLLRVARVNFAVDILAPGFVPDRECLVVPPGTNVREHAGPEESETQAVGARVSGLRAGAIANRQLAIYDKRAEVLKSRKDGWRLIWNRRLEAAGKPPLDLADPEQSRVWRFELRMGSKQLRNRWEMRGWHDLKRKIGDALPQFCDKIRYCIPTTDSNRSRWPEDPVWQLVRQVASHGLAEMRSGAEPQAVKEANRLEHMRMLDDLILGTLISRAAAEGVTAEQFEPWLQRRPRRLIELSREHPLSISERLAKAEGRYCFR